MRPASEYLQDDNDALQYQWLDGRLGFAMRRLSAKTAGAVALPRGASPNASNQQGHCASRSITPHVPTVGTSASLASDISSSASLPALKSPQRRRQSAGPHPARHGNCLCSWARLQAGQGILRSAHPLPGQHSYHIPDQDRRINRKDFSISSVSIAIRLRRHIEASKTSCKLDRRKCHRQSPRCTTGTNLCNQLLRISMARIKITALHRQCL